MTYGSSIFTSWFQLICGSQRSQLEFVLWWCDRDQWHGYGGTHLRDRCIGLQRTVIHKQNSFKITSRGVQGYIFSHKIRHFSILQNHS